MSKSVRAAATLAVCLLILTACGFGPGSRGLPDRPEETGGPAPMGHIVFQPPFSPFAFFIDNKGKVEVIPQEVTLKSLVTRLGVFTVKGNVVTDSAGKQLASEPADVTQIVICLKDNNGQNCKGYQIGTGRRIRIEMDGHFVQVVERNRITIEAAPGSTVNVTDNGPPTNPDSFGPARIDVEEFHFQETGRETIVDLEKSRSGAVLDLSYNHITGELKPQNGTKVSLYATHGWWTKPSVRSDYPGEQECLQKSPADWRDSFDKEDLVAKYSIYCIKTAEGDLGFLFIEPDFEQKPVAYYVYSLTWVR